MNDSRSAASSINCSHSRLFKSGLSHPVIPPKLARDSHVLRKASGMRRTPLVLMLIISMLLGQSLCCCTSKMFVLAASTQDSSTADSSTAEACCCEQSGNPNECPHRSKNSPHECPCKKNKAVSARLDTDVSLPSVLLADLCRFVHDCEIFLSWSPVSVQVAEHFDSSAFPHLDRAGILRAVNSLRC